MINQSNKLSGPFLIDLKNKFREIAGEDNKIDRNEFHKGLALNNEAIVNRKRWEVYGETERKGIIDDSFSRYVNHRSDFLPEEEVRKTVGEDKTSKGGRKTT